MKLFKNSKNESNLNQYYLFGAGTNGRAALSFFGDRIIAIVDNDLSKVGDFINGIEVISFDDLKKEWNGEIVIISAYLAADSIKKQLLDASISNYYVCPDLQSGYFELDRIIENKGVCDIEEVGIYHNTPLVEMCVDKIEKVTRKTLERRVIEDIRKESFDFDVIITESEKIEGSNVFNIVKEIESWGRKRDKRLERFRGIHNNQQCFLIGNGPSLTISDLDILYENKELCMGCNSIYKVYKKTKWRPRYWVVSDTQSYPNIENLIDEDIISFLCSSSTVNDMSSNTYYFRKIMEKFNQGYPSFSDDITKGVFGGRTVMYLMLQIAIYMGCNPIYLVGVDFTWGEDGRPVHFCKDYDSDSVIKESDTKKDIIYKTEQEHAYISALRYAEKKGIEILNATRGGKLEIFDRVDFEMAVKKI